MTIDRVYEGIRPNLGFVVTVTDFGGYGIHQRQLEDRGRYTHCGFGWGYYGSGTLELAYAILLDHFGDAHRAEQYAEAFALSVCSRFSYGGFRLTSADIDERMALIHREEAVAPAVVERLS